MLGATCTCPRCRYRFVPTASDGAVPASTPTPRRRAIPSDADVAIVHN
jgi:hypothetical protein